jgi:regulator of protease activity HflC (stomatin/prohibitin superfamily)
MKTKNIFNLVIAVFAALALASCTVEVPPGYQAMLLTPDGFSGEVLGQGRHACMGRQRMILVDSREETMNESMNILCADDVNFSFDMNPMFETKQLSSEEFIDLMIRKGSDLQEMDLQGSGKTGARVLTFETMYNTYMKPVGRSVSRSVVSRLPTDKVVDNREKIEKDLFTNITTLSEGTPLTLKQVTTSNFDYPEFITNSLNEIKNYEIGIGEEKARQARLLQEYENRQKLAQKRKIRRTTEALSEKGYVNIMSTNLTDPYLDLREIEVEKKLYELAGSKATVVVGSKGLLNK